MNSRIERILRLSRDNDINYLDVMEIYSKFNYRVYGRAIRKDMKPRIHYEPELEEQTMKLTERYFRRYGK